MGSKHDFSSNLIDIRSTSFSKGLSNDATTLKNEVLSLLSKSTKSQSVGVDDEYIEWHRSIPTRKYIFVHDVLVRLVNWSLFTNFSP